MNMRLSSFVACAVAASASLAAQVPYRHILVAESTGTIVRTPFSYLDPTNGIVTPLLPQPGTALQRQAGAVAIDPLDPLTIYTSGGISISIRPSYMTFAVEGSRYRLPTNQTMTGVTGAIGRMWIDGTDVLAAIGGASGGLYRWPIGMTRATLLAPLPNAYDVTVIGRKAYVSSFGLAQPTSIVEVDLVTGAPTLFGSTYPTFKALTSLGTMLVGCGEDGQIYAITPGNAAVIASPNRGPIVAAAAEYGGGTFWFATSNEVLQFPGTVVQRFAGTITDIDVGPIRRASLVTAGEGCAGNSGSTPRHEFVGRPSIGNAAWSMRMVGGVAQAPTFLMLGSNRAVFAGVPLPFDLGAIGMPGCQLYTDRIFTLSTVLDASGAVSVPLPVPNDNTLTGGRLTGQFLVLTIGANPLGLLTSDVAEGIVY